MSDVYDVIYAPVVTEKSAEAIENDNVYTFIVDRKANKIEISRAIESIWDVKVSDVRTMRYSGKVKRALMGRLSQNSNIGRRPAFKKAVVQLAEGDHIEFYEVG
jgi:large subunit ribosomal protein L23